MSSPSIIVFFKLETTGPDPAVNEIIEFAAVAIDTYDGAQVDAIDLLIRPDKSKWAQNWIVNYDKERWATALTDLQAIEAIDAFLKHHASVKRKIKKGGKDVQLCRLAGHGVSKFDFPFLLRWFRRDGFSFPADAFCLDTAQLLAMMMPTLAADVGYEELTIETLCGLLDVSRPREYHDHMSPPLAHASAAAACAIAFWFRSPEGA